MAENLLESRRETKIIGKHVYGNLYECDRNLINSEQYLRETVLNAIKLANMHLIEVKSWILPGIKGGVSIIALITESHITIHTWAEYNYASVDVYTCGNKSNPVKAFKYIVQRLRPKFYTIHKVRRDGFRINQE
ncbi:MAG: adenosylmethionine decarboxylase [Thermoproteota archaeon]